jgi:gallate dioxygenase
MAKIIGGIASSHSPTIGFARDTNKQNDPAWAPIFEGYKPIQKWLKEKDPDVLLIIYNDPVKLTEMTIAEYATLGGMEGTEIIMWLVMRGALSASVRMVHNSYYLPSMAALATAIFEHRPEPFTRRELQDHLNHIHHQLKGVEKLDGTYPYILERSHKGYRINKFLHQLTLPEYRERFLADEESLIAASDLTKEERDLIRRRDWRAMIHYGVTFFVLEKLGAVVGISNPHIYAAMRGETLDEFQNTRNVSVQYSVAGGENATKLSDARDK